MRFRFPKKFKWPYDGATTIAVLALIIASLEYVTPLVKSLYAKPQLVVEADEWSQGGFSGAVYEVFNAGNAPANSIEIGLILLADQRITIDPYLRVSISEEKGEGVKDVRIETERLLPGERFFITVSYAETPRPKKKAIIDLLNKVLDRLNKAGINAKQPPIVRFARCAEGAATFISTSETQDQLAPRLMK